MNTDPFPPDILPGSKPRAHAVRLYAKILDNNPDADREVVVGVLTHWLTNHGQLVEVRALIERLDRLAQNLANDSKELAKRNDGLTETILAAALRRN
jgi:hypothetical protein